jgi:hypothetical protein
MRDSACIVFEVATREQAVMIEVKEMLPALVHDDNHRIDGLRYSQLQAIISVDHVLLVSRTAEAST